MEEARDLGMQALGPQSLHNLASANSDKANDYARASARIG